MPVKYLVYVYSRFVVCVRLVFTREIRFVYILCPVYFVCKEAAGLLLFVQRMPGIV